MERRANVLHPLNCVAFEHNAGFVCHRLILVDERHIAIISFGMVKNAIASADRAAQV